MTCLKFVAVLMVPRSFDGPFQYVEGFLSMDGLCWKENIEHIEISIILLVPRLRKASCGRSDMAIGVS